MVQHLRDTREKYDTILRLARALASHFYHVVTTQVTLLVIADIFLLVRFYLLMIQVF